MIEVYYSLTIGSNFLEKIADGLSAGYREKVLVKDNALVFPEKLAKGRFEFYSLDAGIGLCLIDCRFYEEIRLVRLPMSINYFHTLSFNLSTISFMVEKHDAGGLHIGDSWKKKFLYSTSEKGLSWTIPANSYIRMVVVYLTRGWLLKNYNLDALPRNIPYTRELAEDLPLQFNLDLDLELLFSLQDLLDVSPSDYMKKMYYEGGVRNLIASVANRLLVPSTPDNKLKYVEVAKIMDIEKRLGGALDSPLPSLDELARECFMSKSKFERLFKAIYGKSYIDFFCRVKMRRAEELLLKGHAITEVARAVGYNNLNHFTKVFKSFFRTTPRSFVMNIKK